MNALVEKALGIVHDLIAYDGQDPSEAFETVVNHGNDKLNPDEVEQLRERCCARYPDSL